MFNRNYFFLRDPPPKQVFMQDHMCIIKPFKDSSKNDSQSPRVGCGGYMILIKDSEPLREKEFQLNVTTLVKFKKLFLPWLVSSTLVIIHMGHPSQSRKPYNQM